jgi:hypothetical protein
MSNTATKEPTAAERAAFEKSFPGVIKLGDWASGLVVIIEGRSDDADDKQGARRHIFAVKPLPDGVLIEPVEDYSPIAKAYAADASSLINFWRRMESDATILGKLQRISGGSPTLASVVLEALVEHQVTRAQGTVTRMGPGGNWGG